MKFLGFLYSTIVGRAILKLFTLPWFSKLVGKFLDSPCSKFLIKGFVRRNGINLEDYEENEYACFNDCFTRKMKSYLRPIQGGLVAPCDSFLSAFKIEEGTLFTVKGSNYTIYDLLKNRELADKYIGGTCLIFRLSTEHYHRYCFCDDGTKGESAFIPGRLHTVQPFAQRRYPVYTENCREYTVLHTQNFSDVVQMEVGALLVGKIANHPGIDHFEKGQEKGMFLYGGSTVILLIEKNRIKLDNEDFFDSEIEVRMGQMIGKSH